MIDFMIIFSHLDKTRTFIEIYLLIHKSVLAFSVLAAIASLS